MNGARGAGGPGARAPAFALARLRLRSIVRRRWRGLVAVALVVGVIGGLGLASIAGARRTQSSFTTFLAGTNPADQLSMDASVVPTSGMDRGYAPAVARRLSRLPGVTSAATVVGFDGNLQIAPPSRLRLGGGQSPVVVEGSTDGEYTRLDKVTLVAGRLPSPTSLNEMVLNSLAERQLGAHLGSAIHVALYTDAELLKIFAGGKARPSYRLTLRVVGVVVFNTDVVVDDIERLGSAHALVSPAFTRRYASCCAQYSYVAFQWSNPAGARRVAQEAAKVTPRLAQLGETAGVASVTAVVGARALRALRPTSTALAVFGALAMAAALALGVLLLTRQRRATRDEGAVLRALGAERREVVADATLALALAVVAGAALAVALAVALSPIAPLGEVRPVYPGAGVSVDGLVLGLGAALLVAVPVGLLVLDAARESRRRPRARRAPRASRRAASWGLPPSVVEGVRSAFGGSEAGASSGRPAIGVAVLALALLGASLTFGASLDGLVARPPLYGWNWDAAIIGSFTGIEDLPGPQAAHALSHDPLVAAWDPANFGGVTIAGHAIPVMGLTPGNPVQPPVLRGHALDAPDQIVLGADTLSALHARLGQWVSASTGTGPPVRLRVVGVAVLPAIGAGSGPTGHLEMASGAIIADSVIPAAVRNSYDSAVPGPEVILVRYVKGASAAARTSDLARLAHVMNVVPGDQGNVGGVITLLRPAEIVNYRTSSEIPLALSALVAAGAAVGLALGLASWVRSRRRSLAILRALGFTRRQVGAAVATHAALVVAIGVAVGGPLGVLAGRELWAWFCTDVHVVDQTVVPWARLGVAALSGAALAAAATVGPARAAARVSPGALLRAE